MEESKKIVSGENLNEVSTKQLSKFVRPNPKSDKFKVKRFHHVEFWCGDATNTSLRFSCGLVANSDLSTGNNVHATYVLRSGDLNFLFTTTAAASTAATTASIPTFDHQAHAAFVSSHSGLGVCTVAIEVEDAQAAYATSVAAGARPSSPPVLLEIELFGDVILRYISHATCDAATAAAQGHDYFFPKFFPVHNFDQTIIGSGGEFGFKSLDHEFEKFEPDDLVAGLTESKFETMFLADNSESIILNFSEPTYGTATKSPMETYLDRNQGPGGVQHLALITDNIFKTIREMKKTSLFNYMSGLHYQEKNTSYKDLKKKGRKYVNKRTNKRM